MRHIEEVSYEAMCLELADAPSPQPTPEEALEQREYQLMDEFGLTYMEAWNLVNKRRTLTLRKH